MRLVGLIIALVLLGVGLYRLFMEERAARQAPRGGKRTGPAGAAAQPSPARSAARAAPVKTDPARSPARAEPAGSGNGKAEPGHDGGSGPQTPGRDGGSRPQTPGHEDAEPAGKALPSLHEHHDEDEDITIITLAPSPEIMAAMNALAAKAKPAAAALQDGGSAPKAPPSAPDPLPARIEQPLEEDDEVSTEAPSAVPILYDEEASVDEPTRISPLILVSAAAQTDQGRRRRRNEDSMLVLEDHYLYVVADGMGGHAGGDVASKMAVEIIADAFKKDAFTGEPYPDVPRRGAELALAIQMANKAIYDHARANLAYQGMGTTVVSARFSPNKQRVYFGHVGDSRCYRLRSQQLTQITTDHTMASQGVTGPLAGHLNRAVGVQPGVKVDLIIARPSPDDVYLLCSDGLSKMVPDEEIQGILNAELGDVDQAVHKLIDRANARGGRDNITVVLVQVKDPKGLAKYIQDKSAAS